MRHTNVVPPVGEYVLEVAYTRMGFVARHVMVTRVHGIFERFQGLAHIDLEHPSRSKVQVDIEAASVSTGIQRRDAHLRSSEFLDAAHHPLITYRSSTISRLDYSAFLVAGDLTLRGVTQAVPLVFTFHGTTQDKAGDIRLAFSSSVVVSRRAWEVGRQGASAAGNVLVADRVLLELDINFRSIGDDTRDLSRSQTVTPLRTARS